METRSMREDVPQRDPADEGAEVGEQRVEILIEGNRAILNESSHRQRSDRLDRAVHAKEMFWRHRRARAAVTDREVHEPLASDLHHELGATRKQSLLDLLP